MRLRSPFAAGVLVGLTAACPSLAQSVELSGIAHVAVRVSDLGKSRAFYGNLGFQQAFEFSDAGKVTQSFIKINDRQFIELYPRSEENHGVGFMHVCYESTNISSLREWLAKQGVNPTDVRKAHAGNLLLVLHDPENRVVEYTQYLPGSLHWEDRGKHLGPNRVSGHLARVVIPVKDAVAEREFYLRKLAFSTAHAPSGGHQGSLRIPGSDDSFGLAQTGKGTTELDFTVDDLKETARRVHNSGLIANERRGSVTVTDPDGNAIVFEK